MPAKFRNDEKNTVAENELIFVLLRQDFDNGAKKEARALLTENLDWERIISSASANHVLALIYHRIDMIRPSAREIPGQHFDALRSAYYSNLYRNIRLMDEFSKILETLNAEDIIIMVLRGAIFMNELYHNPALRAITDIDILVQENDIDRVRNIAQDAGYREYFQNGSPESQIEFSLTKKLNDKLDICLDVHRQISPARPQKIVFPYLWERARQSSIAGQRVKTLPPEETLLVCALHLRRHLRADAFRLKFIIDISELLKQYGKDMDWAYLRKLAGSMGAKNSVYLALYCAKEMLKADIHEKIHEEFSPGTAKIKLIRFCLNRKNIFNAGNWRRLLLRFLIFDRVSESALYLWRVSFIERLLNKTKP